ncbi:MAG: lipid II:glycine glycyltransferase FemX [Candidatus Limnocylindrales bacterium]
MSAPPPAPGALSVRAAGEDDRTQWDAFVRSRPEADVLQLWVWGEVAGLGGEPAQRILVEDAAGRVRGVAQTLVRPTSGGRSVLYVPHGPLWERSAPDGAAVLTLLLEGLRGVARAARGILLLVDPRALPVEGVGVEGAGAEADADGDGPAVAAALHAAGLRPARHDLQARATRLIELRDGGPELQASWHQDARRRVRRAAKEGVSTTVDRMGDPAALVGFQELWQQTGERAAFRTRSLEAVKALAYGAAAGDGWYLALAWRGGRPIAGVACPRLADRGYYLWAASARDPELSHAYGGYAALAALCAALAADGATSLDMWGVAEGEGGPKEAAWAGFSSFKRKFDGRPLRHPGTFELVVDPLWYRVRSLGERLRGAAS